MICTDAVMQTIGNAFGFQEREVTAPPQIFGPVDEQFPPGALFSTGQLVIPDQPLVPIRGLSIEPRRVVIDVAGHTEAADAVYSHLLLVLSNYLGNNPLGEPDERRDASDLVVRMDFASVDLLRPTVGQQLLKAAGSDHVALTYAAQPWRSSDYEAMHPGEWQPYILQPRAGAPLGDRLYFSSAPLTSSEHLAHLVSLEAIVVQSRSFPR
jgi:hypothetical protein